MQSIEVGSVTISFPQVVANDIYMEIQADVTRFMLSTDNMASVLLQIMVLVEKYGGMTGEQKKGIVLFLINTLIDSQFTGNRARDMKVIAELALPSVIDMFVNLDKNKIRIAAKKGFKRLFSCCYKK